MSQFITILTVFVLAVFVGFEIITKVPSLLHTPLMSGSNAISGISVVGAVLAVVLSSQITENEEVRLVALSFASLALFFAAVNVAGGFVVTHRMLQKFKPRSKGEGQK
ncbi:NAD(P) transhydrogenase subunit alpha [Chitinivibrio alkaliphilus]|uniref:NAD(P) transhydrogenase subunit alpha n=1 Tax=Chitinivibrio alkaliphilus TaxID=1505232 RepID=UPI00054E8A18